MSVNAQYSAEIGGPALVDRSGRPIDEPVREQALTTGKWLPSGNVTVPPRTSPIGTPVISLKRLAHTVPSKAQKEYERANGAMAKAHIDEAVLHFERAVELDPEFVEAVNDLGAAYAKQGKAAVALKQFEKAATLDARYTPAFYNLSLIYLGQERLNDAARAARTAVDIDPSHLQARLVLGMALVFGDQFTDEAVANLRRCTDLYPQAHLFLARALAGRGEKAPARSEIETFLASGEKTGRDLAQSWLQALR